MLMRLSNGFGLGMGMVVVSIFSLFYPFLFFFISALGGEYRSGWAYLEGLYQMMWVLSSRSLKNSSSKSMMNVMIM